MSKFPFKIIGVALKMPKPVPKLITFAGAVHLSMSSHERYNASADRLAMLKTNIRNLVEAEAAFVSKPPLITIEKRNEERDKVILLLRFLKEDVKKLVLLNLANAELIIREANMTPVYYSNNIPFQNKAKQGPVTGSIVLKAAGQGHHEWRMSEDDIHWINLEGTSGATNIVTNLEEGLLYYFQNRRILTKGRKTAWSPSVKIRVKEY